MMRKDRSWKNLAKTKLEVFKKEGINNFKQEILDFQIIKKCRSGGIGRRASLRG